MIVGILSDTHDRVAAMAAGVRTLTANGAEFLIHCGDIGGTLAIDCLTERPAAFVWGNNDWDRAGLSEYATNLGIQCLETGGDLELDGKRFYVTHGDEIPKIRRVLDEQSHDYLLLGHTHAPMDETHGRVRAINPGALYRAPKKTVALLDLSKNHLQFLEVRI